MPIYEDNPKIPVIAIYGGSSLSNSETRDITYPCPCASGCQHITMNKAYPYGEFLFKCVHLYPCGAGPPEPPELQDGVLLTPQSL